MSEGNDRQLWVAAPGETPTYARVIPQRDMTISDTRETQDSGHKNSGGFNTVRSGNRSFSISLDFVSEWPDAAASVLYTAHKAGTEVLAQVRIDGAVGADPADVVWACEMLVTSFSRTDPYNGVSTGSLTLNPSAPPTVDELVPA